MGKIISVPRVFEGRWGLVPDARLNWRVMGIFSGINLWQESRSPSFSENKFLAQKLYFRPQEGMAQYSLRLANG